MQYLMLLLGGFSTPESDTRTLNIYAADGYVVQSMVPADNGRVHVLMVKEG